MVREKLKEELDVCVRRSLIAKALLEVCVVCGRLLTWLRRNRVLCLQSTKNSGQIRRFYRRNG
jgi:tRNA(Arg) A34 adenosine deaminase TadA